MKLWSPSKHDVVCHRHFRSTDFTTTQKSERKRLKNGTVPSIFLERASCSSVNSSHLKEKRQERADKRRAKKFSVCTPSSSATVLVPDIQQEIEVSTETVHDEPLTAMTVNTAIQCNLLTNSDGTFSARKFKENPSAIRYYTGFDDYEHFMMFFTVLGPAVAHLNRNYKLEPCDQLFLTMIKMRQNKDDYELGLLFDLSKSVISRIVNTWINFMYFQLKEINWWPRRSETSAYMPEDSKRKFPSTRVILDATEIPIEKTFKC
ncbi:uncharacterized protein LOC132746025 [Ruditapes philippinarum]|uniref:uncharacterized protein LOC132746025 n=1 Tax=Ruditapes philippinarum TaxID=129788 RepID=UPI00295B2C89|nr:uncharacterized protein LOC132746025 [Ruditapes philippinarum]